MRVVILAFGATAALIAGCAEDEPGEVEPTAVETVTVTETVEVVGQACLDALDQAEISFGYAGDAAAVARDNVQAAFDRDADALEEIRDRIADLADGLEPVLDAYYLAASECREAVD